MSNSNTCTVLESIDRRLIMHVIICVLGCYNFTLGCIHVHVGKWTQEISYKTLVKNSELQWNHYSMFGLYRITGFHILGLV
jgi:hypothetical protein